MALSRRTGRRFEASIWPGFVDAMTGLLLVLMFVLTIFMIVQFVLRQTITGQETKLGQLSAEVSSLSQALGLEQDRSATLSDQVGGLTSALADIRAQSEAQSRALKEASAQITSFEAQVASLLAAQGEAEARIAGLTADLDSAEAERARLLSAKEALDLALASARDEIDAGAEAARLAAARREALEALLEEERAKLAQGQDDLGAAEARISTLEADKLADAAAAAALRQRLEDADAELTSMTLTLEKQRREAENTLTLLAAADTASREANVKLAAALLAQRQAEAALEEVAQRGDDLDAQLLAMIASRDSSEQDLAAARQQLSQAEVTEADLQSRLTQALARIEAAQTETVTAQEARTALEAELAKALQEASRSAELEAKVATSEQSRTDLEARLTEALLAQEGLKARVDALTGQSGQEAAQLADLQSQLAEALAGRQGAQSEADRQAALLVTAQTALTEEQALSAQSQRELALLNQQVSRLRQEVGTLKSLLDLSDEKDREAQVEITSLGQQLNTALARVASEEKKRAELEAAERARIEQERDQLELYKSDFFGALREVLAGEEGVRIVGDRFVFSSEVLFKPGEAVLSPDGKEQIARIAQILRDVSSRIPEGIDWVIRVDGHTDDTPLSGFGEFANNWELSQARALSVVLYMLNEQGLPPNRLAANGFGEHQPIARGDSDEARALNRRIELKLTER